MALFFLVINYLVLEINFQTGNIPNALGGGLYILGYFALSIIATIIIAIVSDFNKFKKIDIILFVLCTPISCIITILTSNIIM